MKLSSNQYFILALVALAILAAVAFLHQEFVPVLVGILVGILYAAAHQAGGDAGVANIQRGLNLGVPLQMPGGNTPGNGGKP